MASMTAFAPTPMVERKQSKQIVEVLKALFGAYIEHLAKAGAPAPHVSNLAAVMAESRKGR